MKDGIKIKTSAATINIDIIANDEQTLNMLRDSLTGWYEGFCTDCLDSGISCVTTFSREETNKFEVKQELNKIYGMQYADTDSVKVSAPAETAKSSKHVYDMFKHFKAVTTTACKECDECAKAAADYVINLEEKIKNLEAYIDDVETSQMYDREDLQRVMKEIGIIINFLNKITGDHHDYDFYRAEELRGDSN